MRAPAWLLVLPLVVACASAPGDSPTPVSVATPTLSPTATPRATPAPTPEPVLDFPPVTGVALEPGRYSSQPPFDVPFSFEIPVDGWGTAHHHADFLDIIQPVSVGVSPTRWVAFARPEVLYGIEDIPADGLTPADVVAVFDGRSDMEVGEPRPYEIDGLAGLVFEMSTDQTDVEPFGGPGGDLQLDPAYETRTIAVSVDGAPLLVIVFAPRGEMEDAWADSKPVVDSIRW